MVVKIKNNLKSLLQTPGIFRCSRGARVREGFFKTGSPTSCHNLKHKSTDSAYLGSCCWLQACGLLAGGRRITIYISECQGGARDEEEAEEKVPPQKCPHLNICTTGPLLEQRN